MEGADANHKSAPSAGDSLNTRRTELEMASVGGASPRHDPAHHAHHAQLQRIARELRQHSEHVQRLEALVVGLCGGDVGGQGKRAPLLGEAGLSLPSPSPSPSPSSSCRRLRRDGSNAEQVDLDGLLATSAAMFELAGSLADDEHVQLAKAAHVLSANPEINLDEKCGEERRTALHRAAKRGRDRLAELLLQHGAGVDERDAEDRTPLHEAAVYGQLRVARVLVEHNAQVDAVKQTGSTPLYRAVTTGHKSVAEFLVLSGSDPTLPRAQDNNGPPTNALKEMLLLMPGVAVHVFTKRMVVVDRQVWGFIGSVVDEPDTALHRSSSEDAIRGMVRRGKDALTEQKRKKREAQLKKGARGASESPGAKAWRVLTRQPKPQWSCGVMCRFDYHGLDDHTLHLLCARHDHALVSHPLIQTWVEYKWKSLKALIIWRFLEHLLFAVGVSTAAVLSEHALRLPFWIAFAVAALLWVRMLVREWLEAYGEGLERYLSDLWNVLDTGLVLLLVLCTVTSALGNALPVVTAVTVVLMWARLLYFARAFRATGPITVTAFAIFRDAFHILWILLLLVVAFAQAFATLSSHQDTIYESPWQNLILLFFALFGDFDVRELRDLRHPAGQVFMGVFLLFGSLLLVNLVIAIMTNTISRINARSEATYLLERLRLVRFMLHSPDSSVYHYLSACSGNSSKSVDIGSERLYVLRSEDDVRRDEEALDLAWNALWRA